MEKIQTTFCFFMYPINYLQFILVIIIVTCVILISISIFFLKCLMNIEMRNTMITVALLGLVLFFYYLDPFTYSIHRLSKYIKMTSKKSKKGK
jgi:hypothetical protein